jgi:OPT family oligopeptide transporter
MILGTLWCILLGIANAILSFRTNTFSIDSVMASLLSFPLGKCMAYLLPAVDVGMGRFKFSLNPGPFSIKEHVLISIIASAGAAGAYGIDNVIVQRMDMFIGNKSITILESLAWVFATQFIGYGIAGISRRFLIKPKAMLWPGILSQAALFVTLHNNEEPSGRWTMSRFRFFCKALIRLILFRVGFYYYLLLLLDS